MMLWISETLLTLLTVFCIFLYLCLSALCCVMLCILLMTSVTVTDMLLLMLWIYETPLSRNREKIVLKLSFRHLYQVMPIKQQRSFLLDLYYKVLWLFRTEPFTCKFIGKRHRLRYYKCECDCY